MPAFRKKGPELDRPREVPFYPLLPVIMLLLSAGFLAMAVFRDPSGSLYALVFPGLSYPLYRIVVRFNKK